jgi:SAM-dependent methyltransferase
MHISNWLRRIGLLSITDKFRFFVQKKRRGASNRKFMDEHPQFPFPPPYFIYEAYQLNYELYYHDGQGTAKEIIESIKKYSNSYTAPLKILDWGCGPGRITRHMPDFLAAESKVFGTDYNAEYIHWCQQNIPQISWSINSVYPPLNFADDSFDAVVGLSVFTHLSSTAQQKWIAELYRIMQKNAILYITTQGNAFREKLSSGEKKEFDKGSVVERKTIREGHRLFSTFHPVNYVRNLLEWGFEVCELVEGSNLHVSQPQQDIWILKKKA